MNRNRIAWSVVFFLTAIFTVFVLFPSTVDGTISRLRLIQGMPFDDEIGRLIFDLFPRKREAFGEHGLTRIEQVFFSMHFEGNWDEEFVTTMDLWAHLRGYVRSSHLEEIGHVYGSKGCAVK